MFANLVAFKSQAIAFLLGVLTGAGGSYLADKYTDRRRQQEAAGSEKRQFQAMYEKMPALLDEMRQDFSGKSSFTREFILASRGWTFGGLSDVFIYYFEDHPDLEPKMQVLENCGYVIDVTRGSTKRFRATEPFVALLARPG